MKYYSQVNPLWVAQQLGTCKGWNIKNGGCFITSLAMLYSGNIKAPNGKIVECTPSILDWIATVTNLYKDGCLVVQSSFAKLLNLEDNGKSTKAPTYPCIAETDHYKKIGISQHFFIHLPNGNIVDPLDGNALTLWKPKEKANPYKIVSYRLLKVKVNDCTQCTHCCPVHCPNN